MIEAALGDRAAHSARGSTTVTPTSVRLAGGDAAAGARRDRRARPAAPAAHLALGYQTFLGQEVRLAAPHGLTAPIIMDASVAQQGGYRFVYVLPFGPDRVLIEDTHYVDTALWEPERLRANIAAYAAARGWQHRRRAARRTRLAADRAGRRLRRASGRDLDGQPDCRPARRPVPPDHRLFAAACRAPGRADRRAGRPVDAAPALFAAIRADARCRNGAASAFSACSTACCSWPASADHRWQRDAAFLPSAGAADRALLCRPADPRPTSCAC